MTKKSASQMKLMDGKKKLPPIEDVLATQREGMLATIELQIKQDLRFDTLMAIKQSYDRFLTDGESGVDLTLGQVKKLAERVKMQHESVKKLIEDMTIDQITSEDFVNPCDSLVDFVDPESWRDVFEQSVFFSAVQPYGQAFDDLHARMMEEASKREDQ